MTDTGRNAGVSAGIAVALFLVAHANGGYGLSTRSTLGIAIWFGIALAAVTGLALPVRLSGAAKGALVALSAFAGLTLASTGWAAGSELAFDEFARVVLLLGVVAATLALARPDSERAWADGLAWGIAAVGALAISSRLLPGYVHGDAPLTFLAGTQTRLNYPLGYWTALGVLMALGYPLFLLQAVTARTALGRATAIAPTPLLGAVLYLTSARLAVIVLVLGLLVYTALSGRRFAVAGATLASGAGAALAIAALVARSELLNGPLGTSDARSDGRIAAAILALAMLGSGALYAAGVRFAPPAPRVPVAVARTLGVAVLIAAVVAIVLAHPVSRFDAIRAVPPGLEQATVQQHFLSASSNGRWQLWHAAYAEFASHWIAGNGAGSFEAWWAQHGSLAFFARDAHSLFLEQLGELGILGGALIAATFACAFSAAGGRYRRSAGRERETVAALVAVLAAYVAAAAVDWMWENTAVTLVGLVVLGLVIGRGTPRRPSRGRAALFAGVALAAVAIEAVPYLTQSALAQSRAAFRRNDVAASVQSAADARALEPWAATPALQLALVYEPRDLAAADRWIESAIRRNPANWQLYVIAARIQTKRGEVARAARNLRTAQRLNPRSPFIQSLLGRR